MIRAEHRSVRLRQLDPDEIAEMSRNRLARAIQDMHSALGEQKTEIRRFQETVRTLADSVDRLREGWQRYDTTVQRIDVSRLTRRARRLARIMDV